MFYEVADYIAEGKVHYTAFRSESQRIPFIKRFAEGLQGRAFQQCFEWGRNYFNWIAFTDLDEVMVVTDPRYNSSLPAVLRRYEDHGAVIVNWVGVGSGGLTERAAGQGRLKTFTKCTPPKDHVKGIANTKYASLGINAHTFIYHRGHLGVRIGPGLGDKRRVGTAHLVKPPIGFPLALFHYSGAINEWKDKVSKLGAGVSGFTTKKQDNYRHIEAASTQSCMEAARVAEWMPTRPKPGCSPQSLEDIAALARRAAATAVPTQAPVTSARPSSSSSSSSSSLSSQRKRRMVVRKRSERQG